MSTEIEIVGYLRASPDGQPEWSEDCVCEEAVYPNYDGDESVSMPICRLADALAVIAQRDARIAELEATKLHGEMVMLRTDRDRLAAELKYTIAAYVTGNKPSGVVLPERMVWDGLRATACNIRGDAWNACLDEVARLNPCRVQAVPDDIHDQHRKAMKLLREVRSWIIPKGNISMSIIERVGAFLDSAAPSAQQKESSDE